METLDDEKRDRLLHNYNEGVILVSSDGKEVKISRKLAIYSEILRTAIEESPESKEDRKGWTQEQYKNEPLIQIEIPVPFTEKLIRIVVSYLGSMDNPTKRFDLDSYKLSPEELTELMKAANWFVLDGLLSNSCAPLVKFYQDKTTMEQIKPFNPESKITRYSSATDIKMDQNEISQRIGRNETYIAILNKSIQSGYEYVLFDGGYFVAVDAHFENENELIKMGIYFPNVVAQHPESKEIKTHVNNVIIQHGTIKILPYTYVYGRISFDDSSADSKNISFKDLIPPPGRAFYIEMMKDNTFTHVDLKSESENKKYMNESEQEKFISYLKSHARYENIPEVVATRREVYVSKASSRIASLPYDQRIVIENLLNDKNFATDYIPICLKESYFHEYKCVPVYTGDITSFSNHGYQNAYEKGRQPFVFGPYAIMFLGNTVPWNNNNRSIVMDTRYPGKNYLINQNGYYKSLVPIDATRFLFKNDYRDFSSVVCYNFKDLTEEKILNPYCSTENMYTIHTQILHQTPRLFTGEEKRQYFTLNRTVQRCSGYILSSDGVFFSVDDCKEIGRFTSTANVSITGISVVGNYIVIKASGGDRYYLSILNTETFQGIFTDESPIVSSLGTVLTTDNPNIIVTYKYIGEMNNFQTMNITVIDKNKVVKQQSRPYEFISYVHLEDGKLVEREIESDPSEYAAAYEGPTTKFDIEYKYTPVPEEVSNNDIKFEQNSEYWSEKLNERLANEVKLDPVSGKYFDYENDEFITYNVSYKKYFYPIGGRDCIIVFKEVGFVIPSVPEKMKCYRYLASKDIITPLNCEGGRIIEVPSTQKIVVEYGYSGFCEIWI